MAHAWCSPSAGYWNVTVFGRRHAYRLYTKLLTEASRWASAIQTVIDSKAPLDTPTQQLIHDIKVRVRQYRDRSLRSR